MRINQIYYVSENLHIYIYIYIYICCYKSPENGENMKKKIELKGNVYTKKVRLIRQ
jgi:hypothetical protein